MSRAIYNNSSGANETIFNYENDT